LRRFFDAGSSGLLPGEIATKLERFKVTRHQISRRILRMNKRLKKEFGEQIAEKTGWHWALTGFTHRDLGPNQRILTEFAFGCEKKMLSSIEITPSRAIKVQKIRPNLSEVDQISLLFLFFDL
jgi:hypothetical protein